MPRVLTVLCLAPILGCGGGSTPPGASDARVQALEQEVADLTERVLATEAGQRDNGSRASALEADVAQLEARLDTERARIDALDTRVDGHDLAVAEASGAVAGLEARLYDPDYGEVPALQAADAELSSRLQTTEIDVQAVGSAVSTNTSAVAALAGTVAGYQTQISANSALSAANAADLADARSDLDANTADLMALEQTVGVHDATLLVYGQDIDNLQQDVASNESAIGANTAAIGANTAAIGTNAGDIAGNSSSVAVLATDVAANRADLDGIASNYLPALDDLLLYVSADPSTDTVTIAQADLQVDGRVFSDDLTLRRCDDTLYSCTPMECVDLCSANGERMATTDEVLQWAAAGNSECLWAWMVDRANPQAPVYGYPMFANRVNPGCGPQGTGDVPRFGDGPYASTWGSTQEFNCACSSN